MSICPICKKRVKFASGNKIKRNGVWQHKHSPKWRENWLKRLVDVPVKTGRSRY